MNIAGCTVCNFKSVHTCVFLKKENIIVWVHWSPFMPHSFLSWMKVGHKTPYIDVIVPLLQSQYIFEVAVRGDDSLLNHDWYM